MTEKDKRLVCQARRSSWEEIMAQELESKAESNEAKNEIRRLMLDDYHRDEARAGME